MLIPSCALLYGPPVISHLGIRESCLPSLNTPAQKRMAAERVKHVEHVEAVRHHAERVKQVEHVETVWHHAERHAETPRAVLQALQAPRAVLQAVKRPQAVKHVECLEAAAAVRRMVKLASGSTHPSSERTNLCCRKHQAPRASRSPWDKNMKG